MLAALAERLAGDWNRWSRAAAGLTPVATKVWALTRRHRELSSSTHRPRDGGPRKGSTDIEISRATCLRSIGYAKSPTRATNCTSPVPMPSPTQTTRWPSSSATARQRA